jgi:hypothetical protein
VAGRAGACALAVGFSRHTTVRTPAISPDTYLRDRNEHLLDRPSPRYPDVAIEP